MAERQLGTYTTLKDPLLYHPTLSPAKDPLASASGGRRSAPNVCPEPVMQVISGKCLQVGGQTMSSDLLG